MPDIQLAHTLGVSQCDCGSEQFHFTLRDREGNVFAIAVVPVEAALMIAEQIDDTALGDEDEIGEVAGNA